MDTNKIIGVTGHRFLMHPIKVIESLIESNLISLAPSKILTGMALGFDQLVAKQCLALKIPYDAIVPFEGQENRWDDNQKLRYYVLLNKANNVIVVNKGDTIVQKLFARNEYIVDNSDCLLAYLHKHGNSGTKHCVEYARQAGKKVTYC